MFMSKYLQLYKTIKESKVCETIEQSSKQNVVEENSTLLSSDILDIDKNINEIPHDDQDDKIRNTIVKKVRTEQLVWAPCFSIKGGNSYIFARICDIGEGASEFIENNKWPPKDNEVLVEYFNVPHTFLKVDVLPECKLVPYYRDPFNKSQEFDIKKDAWNVEACSQILQVIKKKSTISSSKATEIFQKMQETANDFLRLALESSQEPLNNDTYSEEPEVEVKVCAKPPKSPSIQELMKFSRKTRSLIVTLSVGDVIEYFHRIFHNLKMKQVIVSIEPEPDLKLTLDNGDIIDKSDLIKKIDDINCGLMPLNDYLINFESCDKEYNNRKKSDRKLTEDFIIDIQNERVSSSDLLKDTNNFIGNELQSSDPVITTSDNPRSSIKSRKRQRQSTVL